MILRTATDVCESDEWRDDVLEPPDLLGVEAFASIGVTVRTSVKTTPGKQWALQRALARVDQVRPRRGGDRNPRPAPVVAAPDR